MNGTEPPVEGGYRVHAELAAAGLWSIRSDLAAFMLAVGRAYRGEPDGLPSQSSARTMLTKVPGCVVFRGKACSLLGGHGTDAPFSIPSMTSGRSPMRTLETLRRCSALFLMVLWSGTVSAEPSSPMHGRWIFHFVNYGQEFAPARVSMTVAGSTVVGTLNELSLTGTIKSRMLAFRAIRPNGSVFGLFEGRLAGSELRGTMTDRGNQAHWVMRRLPAPAEPTTHSFVPTTFSRTFSAGAAPVLHLNPGDTVRTWTLDSAGYDKSGTRLSFGGNPQTGPFYVNGALPEDTLVVKLVRLTLNRDSGRSGTQLVPTTVNHDYYKDAQYAQGTSGDWMLDRQTMTGRLAHPSAALRDYRVALKPFLGGLGVAPDNQQAIDARSLGSYGGNLDYSALTEGTTVYLPVLEEGALLYFGDGHAAQGDGELTGDAIETSLDVELTVDLIQGKGIGGPRAENDDYMMAMGIAGSTQDALRQATTELARWLASDYALSADEVALVLGTAIEYDVAELVDPQINVVAKIAKAQLSLIEKPALESGNGE